MLVQAINSDGAFVFLKYKTVSQVLTDTKNPSIGAHGKDWVYNPLGKSEASKMSRDLMCCDGPTASTSPPPPPSRPLIKLQLGELEVNPLPREYWMPNGGQIARNWCYENQWQRTRGALSVAKTKNSKIGALLGSPVECFVSLTRRHSWLVTSFLRLPKDWTRLIDLFE